MRSVIIVKNTTTSETYLYDAREIDKARIAVSYLNTTTGYTWYLVR